MKFQTRAKHTETMRTECECEDTGDWKQFYKFYNKHVHPNIS